MEDSKSMIGTGSLLNTSEGLLSTGALAALTQTLMTSDDWKVQAAACVSIAVLGATYVVMRSKCKGAESDA